MKKVILFLLLSSLAFGASFVNPNTFKGSEREKKEVVSWVKEKTKKQYSAIGMDDPATLRMMEKQNLDSFKKLTKVEDKKLLSSVIETYSAIGMNDYQTLFMMYEEQEKASKKKLSW